MHPSAPRSALSWRANSRRHPSALVIRSPVYSMTRVPFGMIFLANIPRPWICDPRTAAHSLRVGCGFFLAAFFGMVGRSS